MRDNELIQLFRPIIISGLADLGFIGVSVVSSYQPKQEGAEINNAIYFYALNDEIVGWPLNVNKIDAITGNILKYQEQWHASTFQINALVNINPADAAGYTARDLIRSVSFILQNNATITELFNNGIGIYRISEIRNPFFTNEYGRYQASPSFDITFTHKTTNTFNAAMVESTEAGIYRV